MPVDENLVMRGRIRLILLICLLIVETIITIVLRRKGLAATHSFLSFMAAAIPVLMAAILFFRHGFRVRLSSLFLSLTCLAVFLAVCVVPLQRERSLRSGTQRWQEAGVVFSTSFSALDFGDENHEHGVITAPNLPAWLMPLSRDLMTRPLDSAVRSVNICHEDDLEAFLKHRSAFDNLRDVCIQWSVRDDAFNRLADEANDILGLLINENQLSASAIMRIGDFQRLSHLHLYNQQLPEGLLAELRSLEALSWWSEGPTARKDLSRGSHIEDIASLPKLRSLMLIGHSLSYNDVRALENATQLKHLWISHAAMTADDIESLRQTLRHCNVRIDVASQ